MKKTITLLCMAALVLCMADAKKAKKERGTKKAEEQTPAELAAPEAAPALTPVRLGVKDSAADALWAAACTRLRQQGIDLQLVHFDGDASPNAALAAGEVELAAYQTQAEFNADCKQNGWKLRVLGSSYAVPFCLCSATLTDADQLRQGNLVIIPKGKKEAGRALLLLSSAGLVTLYRDSGQVPTLGDIERNRRGINFRQSEAALDAALGSAKAVVCTRTAAAALPPEQILYTEAAAEKEYWQLIAAAEDSGDGEKEALYQAVIAAFQTPETESILSGEFGGAFIPAGWESREE